MTDILIIGAGTAGLTAAIYGVRAGLSVEVLEQRIYGGQIINTTSVENYPGMPGVSGADFAAALYEQATGLGAQIQYEAVMKTELIGEVKKVYLENEQVKSAKSLIIATGAKPRKLEVPGEERLLGMGVSYCATCDGAFHRGRDVVVVGGGNTAMDDAAVLAGMARRVYLIHRRKEFRADPPAVERLRRLENVEFILEAQVEEIQGESAVESVVVYNQAEDTRRSLSVSGVFIAAGHEPDNGIFSHEIALSPEGYIVADESCETNLPGVFAAGDTRTKQVRQIVTAAADGAVAALAASSYINSMKKNRKENES
jgi:thioredoxin reductase (NADPH)